MQISLHEDSSFGVEPSKLVTLRSAKIGQGPRFPERICDSSRTRAFRTMSSLAQSTRPSPAITHPHSSGHLAPRLHARRLCCHRSVTCNSVIWGKGQKGDWDSAAAPKSLFRIVSPVLQWRVHAMTTRAVSRTLEGRACRPALKYS